MLRGSPDTFSWQKRGETISHKAELILVRVLQLMHEEESNGRTGVVLKVSVTDKPHSGPDYYMGVPLLDRPCIGRLSDHFRLSRYATYASEKDFRLKVRHAKDGHVSSRQSRNKAELQYQGAVAFTGTNDPEFGESLTIVVSVSGLPEVCDEAFALILGLEMGWTTLPLALKIAETTENTFFQLVVVPQLFS